jgi:hypothetical protein
MNYLCGHAMLADGRLLVAGVTEKFEQTEGFLATPIFPDYTGVRPGTGTSWRATISSPTLWQSDQVSWINSSNRQAGLEKGVAKWNARAEP